VHTACAAILPPNPQGYSGILVHEPMMYSCAGLRLTQQRLALTKMLISGHRTHLSTEILFKQMRNTRASISLATMYNGLSEFVRIGLLQSITAGGRRYLFDNDLANHHHFFFDLNVLPDIGNDVLRIAHLPAPPHGFERLRIQDGPCLGLASSFGKKLQESARQQVCSSFYAEEILPEVVLPHSRIYVDPSYWSSVAKKANKRYQA